MKAVILSADKNILPRFSNETNRDEPTLMVIVQVAFTDDTGTQLSTQSYSYLPDDLPSTPDELQAFFQKQADAMQADLDSAEANQEQNAQSQLADEKLTALNQLIQTDEETQQ